MGWLALLFFPILWLSIDLFASIREHRLLKSTAALETSRDDFQILVPIYGSMRFLENVEYLQPYSDRVILCTTSGESIDFYRELSAIASRNNFQVYRSPFGPPASLNKRLTGGTIRDRVIRDALLNAVSMPYVVCLDADTTTPKPLGLLVGELARRGDDLASIRLVPQEEGPLLVQLQRHEYRQSMRMRFIVPWLVSGACHVGTTEALRHIMRCHSLFFQGNDVETGLIGEQLGYRIGHIPFEVNTTVPASPKAWWRQRLAWSGGEFRLFIANFRYILKHPFLWAYGGLVTIAMFALRWWALTTPTVALAGVGLVYSCVIAWLHWEHRNRWLVLMPLYSLFNSLVLTPIGIVWYFVMAVPDKNFGMILPIGKLSESSAIDSESFLAGMQIDKSRGSYVDPTKACVPISDWTDVWVTSRPDLRAASRTRAIGIIVPENPAQRLKPPERIKTAKRYLSHEEVAALALAVGSRPHGCELGYDRLILLMAYCGLRWGELSSLRIQDLDLPHARLQIKQTVVTDKGYRRIEAPGDYENRSIPIPEFLVTMLGQQVDGRPGSQPVFFGMRTKTYLRNHSFRKGWLDPAAAEVGLDGITSRELCHTAVSLAMAAGPAMSDQSS